MRTPQPTTTTTTTTTAPLSIRQHNNNNNNNPRPEIPAFLFTVHSPLTPALSPGGFLLLHRTPPAMIHLGFDPHNFHANATARLCTHNVVYIYIMLGTRYYNICEKHPSWFFFLLLFLYSLLSSRRRERRICTTR